MKGEDGRARRPFLLLVLLLAVLVTLPLAQPHPGPSEQPLPAHGNTWSIVAADPESGRVGIAAASCFPAAIDAIAALVPGQGVAATQADFSLGNRNQLFDLLQEGRPAAEVVELVSNTSFDLAAARRQYGVVTISGGAAQTAGFTGSENQDWAGDRQAASVSVQGNLLEGEAVVANALAAFQEAAATGEPLDAQSMAALEAGSAAGGDRRCNQNGVRQTASAAFIMVAEADQPPFTVRALGETAVGEADAPALYLSVTEPEGGENAVSTLRAQYKEWLIEQAEESGRLAPPLLAAVVLLLLLLPLAILLRQRRSGPQRRP